MKILGVIPARYASTRFPGKPLVNIAGRTMLERVYRQCRQAHRLSHVVVATDDQRIFDDVLRFGGEVWMTRPDHPTGTDRLLETATYLPGYDAYVNIQGDEPFISPEHVNTLCEALAQQATLPDGAPVVTLVRPITHADDLANANVVKVARTPAGQALYFSRAAIPFLRDQAMAAHPQPWLQAFPFVKHVGIYGFAKGVLGTLATLAQSPLERAESLEQLRWLEAGLRIHAALITDDAHTHAIDTPEDLKRIEALIAAGKLQA
jgi:3-deoxy-manno-octulosonate cytidylyltransferase (CMP-KDO synthetase)